MLASTVRLLLTHPATLARTQADDGLIVKAIEESLRLESPIQWNSRLVLEDVDLGGVTIPAGALVIPAYGSANRDETHFAEPKTFDIDRSDLKNHIGFGHGTHFCMGAPLARMEGRIALQRFLRRYPQVRLSERNDYAVRDSIALRGLEALWLRLESDA
jgi:cytochrome P450